MAYHVAYLDLMSDYQRNHLTVRNESVRQKGGVASRGNRRAPLGEIDYESVSLFQDPVAMASWR